MTPQLRVSEVSAFPLGFNFHLHARATLFDVTHTFPLPSEILAATNKSTFSDATAATSGSIRSFPTPDNHRKREPIDESLILTKPNRNLFTTLVHTQHDVFKP
jgi:hypothetical protein